MSDTRTREQAISLADTRTFDEAVKDLRRCDIGKHWIATASCDSCVLDAHRCPPNLERAAASIRRAIEIGAEAQALAKRLGLAAAEPRRDGR